ncbi:MAG: tetratricopeptide repeat protein [Candidatus Omnitrophota bacterium]
MFASINKKKLVALIMLSILGLFSSCAYALDWQKLHEQADALTLNQASELIRQDPEGLETLYLLGLVYLNLHRDNDALAAFEKILNANPEVIAAKWGRAEVLRRQKKIADSETLLKEVLKKEARFYPADITLSYIRHTQLKFGESVSLAYKVKSAGRENVDLSNYVRALLLIGGGKGMLAHYGGPLAKIFNGTAIYPNLKKAEELQPDSAAVLFGLGSFYFLAPKIIGGDIAKAEDYLKRAIEKDPLFADAYARLSQLFRMKGDKEKAADCLQKALAIDPQNELALDAQSGRCKFICASIKE